jgi:hypothetical protein
MRAILDVPRESYAAQLLGAKGETCAYGSRPYHAVPLHAPKDARAVCGARPGLHSLGWSEPGEQVTCTRCLRRIERARLRELPLEVRPAGLPFEAPRPWDNKER